MEKSILFQPTGEYRKAQPGEWVFDGDVFTQARSAETIYRYTIYTRHEISAEVAQRMMEEAR